MSNLIFDAPWWIDLLCFALGLFIFVSGNRRQNTGTRNLGIGVFALGGLFVLLAVVVDTPKKIARRDVKTLIEAVVAADWTRFQSVLAPNVSLGAKGSAPVSSSSRDLTQLAQAEVTAIHLTAAHVRSIQVQQEGEVVTVSIALTTEQDMAGVPLLDSAWEIKVGQVGSDWKITSIAATEIGGLSTEDIQRELRVKH